MSCIRVTAFEVANNFVVLFALGRKAAFVHHMAGQFHAFLFGVSLLECIVIVCRHKALEKEIEKSTATICKHTEVVFLLHKRKDLYGKS